MKQWQKTFGSILTVGLLLISTGSAMAEDSSVLGEKPVMHQRGRAYFMNESELAPLISHLSSQTQSELLSLVQGLQDLMPEKQENQEKPENDEMKTILKQIEQIFEDNGISIILNEKKPFLPEEAETHPEIAVPTAPIDGTLVDNIEKQVNEMARPERKEKNQIHAAITDAMQNLPEEEQTKILALLAQLEALRPEKPTMTEEEKEAMEIKRSEIEEAQIALQNALKEAGIDFPAPAAPEKDKENVLSEKAVVM